MAFIEKKNPIVLNIMLTSKGRELLSSGNLTFKYFAVGDSEIDYNYIRDINLDLATPYDPFNSSILKPVDKNPKILSFIPKTVSLSGNPYNAISTISPLSYDVVNNAESLGFFTNSGTTFITDSNHVKQPDAMVDMSEITGGTKLYLYKTPAYGTSGAEPAVGDLLYIKWAYNVNTTGQTINKYQPTPYLMYQIISKTGTLAADTLAVVVDRTLPDFSSFSLTTKAGVMIYYNYSNYTGTTIFNTYSTDYIDQSVLSFQINSQCDISAFPFWNMSIIYTEELVGVQAVDRKYGQFASRSYGGFVSYIQNQAPIYKKLGVIHYTNGSPANVYAEGLYLTTPKLEIPTIMWHKSNTAILGLTLTPIGSVKILSGNTNSLNTTYYDLADPSGNIVGKVFTDLKLFVIEDQELLFAMSYKSNRSWTLPDFLVGSNGGCV